MTQLPDPLVPADADVRGLDGFMLDVQRLFSSELYALSTGDEFKAAVSLWGRAWQQTPPGSLPKDDRLLAAFSGAGTKWKKVRAVALRGFVECSDGRLYHKVLCEDVIKAVRKRQAFRERTTAATEARKKRDDQRNVVGHVGRNGQRNDPRDDDWNEKRNDDVGETVTTNVTSLQGQGQGQGQGQKEPSPANPRPPPAAAQVTRADLDGVEAACRGVLGPAAPVDPVIGPIALLAQEPGVSLAKITTILASEARRNRRSPVRTWGMWATIVRERLAAAGPPLNGQHATAHPNDPVVDFEGGYTAPQSTIRRTYLAGHWLPPWRGKPGEKDCVLPKEFERALLEEACAHG